MSIAIETGPAQQADFQCHGCGSCCRVEGYVRLRRTEVGNIAEHLGLSVNDFTRRFTRLTADRQGLSLTEKENGECAFLTDDSACRIQVVKPAQCRDFPHKWHFAGYESVCRSAQRKPTE